MFLYFSPEEVNNLLKSSKALVFPKHDVGIAWTYERRLDLGELNANPVEDSEWGKLGTEVNSGDDIGCGCWGFWEMIVNVVCSCDGVTRVLDTGHAGVMTWFVTDSIGCRGVSELDTRAAVGMGVLVMLDIAVSSGDIVEDMGSICWDFWELVLKPVSSGDVTEMQDAEGMTWFDTDNIESGCGGISEVDARAVGMGVAVTPDTAVTSGDDKEGMGCICWDFWELVAKPVSSADVVTEMQFAEESEYAEVMTWFDTDNIESGCGGISELDARAVGMGVTVMLDTAVSGDDIEGMGCICWDVWELIAKPVSSDDVVTGMQDTGVTTSFDMDSRDSGCKGISELDARAVGKGVTVTLDAALASGDDKEGMGCNCWDFWELVAKPICSGDVVTGMLGTELTTWFDMDSTDWGCRWISELDARAVGIGVMVMLETVVTSGDGIGDIGCIFWGFCSDAIDVSIEDIDRWCWRFG